MMERHNKTRWERLFGLGGVAFAAIILAACASAGTGASSAGGALADAVAEDQQTIAMDIELGDLYIDPGELEVPAGAMLELTVTNAGQLPHDLVLDGEGTRMLAPGETETVTFGPFTADAVVICSVPGHAAAGMTMDVKVTGAAEGAAAADDGVHGVANAPDNSAQVNPNATPGPEWERFDPVLAPAVGEGGTLHQITLEATETVIEVAPGVTQELWTFNDQVPGPILRGKVGDVFEITLVNRGQLGHSIDFHASKVAWNDEMRTLQPGESLVYRFEAKHAGVFMYHCGTAPGLHHIGNGMWGAIIIDPLDLPEVDHEFVLVQSEFYLGPEGEPGDLAKMQNDDWDLVTFNGYHNQYAHAPIRIETDERVRAWVLNVGPSENSSFHVVGTVFDTMYKEGAYHLRPDETRGGAQALDLQPAQGGFVEFTMDEDGLYPIVTHKFSNVGKGAMGLFQAGEVELPAGVAH